MPWPNSPHDWLMPNHLNFLLDDDEVLVGGADVVVVFNVVAAVPGTHWLYQSLE